MRRLKEDPAHLRIMGDGQQIKSYLDVDDAINAVLLANAKHEKGFDAFNVATTSRLTVTQIAKLAIEARGLEVANVRIEYEGGQKGWAGDVPDIRLDATKMVGIGWYPKKGSIEAMRDALETMK
jgi:UDP-glucose 4-epimerase